MARGHILSAFLVLFIITTSLCLKKEKLEKDETRIIQLQDADFFNKVHIEDQDLLVLIVPDECAECNGLMTEFQKSKAKVAEEFPDLTIGYIYGRSDNNALVRRAIDVGPESSFLTIKALVKNRLFVYEGRINMKRLSKWIKEVSESSSTEHRLPPSGVIQMDPAMLRYLTKETKGDLNLLLVPASAYIQNEKFASKLEKTQEHYKKNGFSSCIGLVEEDMPLPELDGVKVGPDDIVLVQKSIGGALFTNTKEMAKDEGISETDLISWIDSSAIQKMIRIQSKAELGTILKDKDFLILGYTSPGNEIRFSSMAKTVGDLGVNLKTMLLSSDSGDSKGNTELFLGTSQIVLSTNTLIAGRFNLEGAKEAIVVIFKDDTKEEDAKAYSVLAKRFLGEKEPIEVQPMVDSLKNLLFGKSKKEEL